MRSEKIHKGKLEKQNTTIYNHTLHYRYRWKLPMIVIQVFIIFALLFLAEQYLQVTNQNIIQSFGYLVLLWLLQGFSFFLYCFISSLSMCWHIDAFLSPWGGWRTKLPLSISDYQQIEWMFFFFGNAVGLLVMAWWGLQHGFLILVLHITLSIPRLFTVLRVQKWKKERKGFVVKHEKQGIGLYSTFG
ncbi:hypothetical protein AM501_18100 [Aneurinibacillus migulanus]|uniref:hypothetical protein n=1 Tax=Aneurinibacillus migulanus TaxID=47500 RepID=UPI0005BA88EA|nr:hypothetical protein [Aneurinibacillus migulanus]KIV59804.1 hypothetical protein TS64_00990 [Aneurinibacillus migulanus]KPD06905.1 hypothetical protein AM501_18100 [Aneurinibacillus migulanus]MCP1358057.1 hypothetical protein [Aneurinibacillus migulanus]CEH27763.1 Uncharacterized protein BN1090_A2_00179 [Aneurinibacillus migulanus]